MGMYDHPVFGDRTRTAQATHTPLNTCDSLEPHEPHWWNKSGGLFEYAQYLCGAGKVIDINEARSKRGMNAGTII
jgi:hypothetical protein